MRESPALSDPASPAWEAVDAAIADGAEAFDRVRSAVLSAAADDPWLAAGTPPRRMVMGSTTDARYYLASIVSGARTLARFMAGFLAEEVRR